MSTVHPLSANEIATSLNSVQRDMAELNSKPSGARVLPQHDDRVGLCIVPVGEKDTAVYVRYVENALLRGIKAVHLVARGEAYIAKAHRITGMLVDRQCANVFRCDAGLEPLDSGAITAAVITLVTASILKFTRPEVWKPEDINEWQKRATAFRQETRCPLHQGTGLVVQPELPASEDSISVAEATTYG